MCCFKVFNLSRTDTQINANFEKGLYKSAALRKALVVSFHEVDDFEEN